MNIELKKYNAVVEGLAAQLELQRDLNREKTSLLERAQGVIDTLIQALKNQTAKRKERDESWTTITDQLEEQLDFCREVALGRIDGDQIPTHDPGWSTALQAVRDLRLELTQAKEKIDSLTARKKKSK